MHRFPLIITAYAYALIFQRYFQLCHHEETSDRSSIAITALPNLDEVWRRITKKTLMWSSELDERSLVRYLPYEIGLRELWIS
jgi:hypothetical protein